MTEILVYDGRQCLGWIIERDSRRCEAYTAAGNAIGVFAGREKATTAVCEAAREQRRGVAA